MKKQNYKKVTAAMFCAALVFGTGCMQASANELNLEGIEVEEKSVPDVIQKNRREGSDAEKSFGVETTDLVMHNTDGSVEINFGSGTMNVLPPFGWVAISQDISQELSDYVSVFSDPIAVAESMVEGGIHLILVDNFSGSMVAFTVDQTNPLSKLVGDLSSLSEGDRMTVQNLLSQDSFPGAASSVVTCGQNVFYRFDSEGAIYYETFMNSLCYDVQVLFAEGTVDADTVTADVEALLADFSVQ